MKLKLFVLLLIATMTKETQAFRFNLETGIRFNYVELRDGVIICTCIGRFSCPTANIQLRTSQGDYAADEIINEVRNLSSKGVSSGEFKYQNDLPVKWKKVKERFEIETFENSVNYSSELPDLQKKYNAGEICTN